jgi:DNA-binding response OmpR family regulator
MANSDRERKRILFVEDHEDIWEFVGGCLEEYTLICVREFDEGLLLAQQRYFDLYILDNLLSGGSGVELCRLIRAFDPHTPILFYSACADASDKQAAYSAGAQAYLTKPVGFDELKMAVGRLTSVPPETVFETRLAEITAIREELAVRQAQNAARVEKSREKYLRAEEKAIRIRAEMAFLAAGGTRGNFAREWPSMFLGEVRSASEHDTAQG